ncbi:MAG: radical SAM protein, partial [Thermoguttaceae bacterium]
MNDSRSVLLVQLPVPPPGPGILEGNEPLAAAYLKLYALRQELDASYQIDVLPPSLANTLGDQGLIREILSREPWMVSFSCYLWNIERSLWISQKLKESRPELLIVLGGPEITSDNPLALGGDLRPMGGRRQIDNLPHQQVDLLHGHSDHLRHSTPVDYAIFGEGEQTFAELLQSLSERKGATALGASAGPEIAGLWQPRQPSPPPRATLPNLDSISSPYVEGILDLSDSRMLLETARGCRFRCRYCYYPKGDRTQRCLSAEQVLSNLAYADAHGAKEVVLLDPTLNQRADFVEFLRLLRRGNPSGRLRFSGELRAEG